MKTKINKKNDYLLGLFIKNNKGEEIVRHLISMALMKLSNFSTDVESYYIEHINSVPYLRDMDE